MKKKLATIVTGIVAVLGTTGFAGANYVATAGVNFPYFQLGCLIVGGLTIVSLKSKYDKIYLGEAIGAFGLYTLFVSLFTNPMIDAIRNLVG